MPTVSKPIKSLDDMMDGGITQRFNRELRRILQNVFDPNTDPKKVRELTIKWKIKPNSERNGAVFEVEINGKTAPMVPMTQMVMLLRDDEGNVAAQEITSQIPGQVDMDGYEQPMPKVINLSDMKKKEEAYHG